MARHHFFTLIKETVLGWWDDKAPRLGAALAYYTSLSLAPLLVLAIGVAGLVFGDEAAQGQLVSQMEDMVGPEGAQMIETLVAKAREPSTSILATVLGLFTLLIGATGVFGQLQEALNDIFGVEQKASGGVVQLLKDRFLSLAMVLGVGFLLLVSLILSAILAALTKWVGGAIPQLAGAMQFGNLAVSLIVVTLLFAMIFKWLPDVELRWRDVWLGAAVTAVLFTIGKFAIGMYLGRTSIGSAYGAAGSFVVLLIWVYYSAQILFLGAEFVKVYVRHTSAGKSNAGANVQTTVDNPRSHTAAHLSTSR